MKLLIVFLGALVLVAYGNVIPSEEFAEEAPAVHEFDAEKGPAAERVLAPETEAYIPSVARSCNPTACRNLCRRLGYGWGTCSSISPGSCLCRNL